ncbi:MAG: acetylxylan esterase [Fuerstiella sp.]|nr:acetylxylan esterase [Fuerstiella sp.]
MLKHLTVAIVFLCLLTAATVADEELSVQSALAKRIIDPQLPLREVQAYAESHVLPMSEPDSVAEWETYIESVRKEVLDKVVFRGEGRKWRSIPTQVQWLETIDGGPGYRIRKLRYEVVPGMWVAALLYEPDQLNGRVPVVMNVNGHDRADGKAADYKQLRCINQAKRGMLALNVEWLGMGQLATAGFSHYSMNQMNLCGTSGLAPFYLAMSRGLDILLQHENADPARVAVAGLSGGGWQTIFISSLDKRVTLANPVAGYSSFLTRGRYQSDLGDSEQTPCDLAMIADYTHLTAMLAPRPALLTKNAEDNCCFRAEHALPPLLHAAQPVYELYGKPANLRYHINHDPGTHNFGLDNRQQLYGMFGDFFFAGDRSFDAAEIPSDAEVKSKEDLFVELPAGNLDFNTLALKLSDNLNRSLPNSAGALNAWQTEHRKRLRKTVRAKKFDVLPIRQSQNESATLSAAWWWLRMNGDWTVPVVELSVPGTKPTKLAVVLSDDGKSAASEQVQRLLKSRHRVLAIDPFYFGESKITERDFLYAILVASVGDRPLGIQASQLVAAARWAREEFQCDEVTIAAAGPRTSVIALTAAGLSANAIDAVQVHDCPGSLREFIEQNQGANQMPEMLCFGLLKDFDVAQLVALAAPRAVTIAAASERLRTELAAISTTKSLSNAFLSD